MRKWTKLVTSGVALLSAATLAACSSGDSSSTESSGDITLKLWVPTESKESYKDTIAEFEKENEGVAEYISKEEGIELLEIKNLIGYGMKADSMFVAVLRKHGQ